MKKKDIKVKSLKKLLKEKKDKLLLWYQQNKKYIFLITCIYLLFFQNFLQSFIPFFRFFDEFLAVLLIPFVFKRIFIEKKRIIYSKYDVCIGMCLILITIVGFLSNYIYKYQNIGYVLIDFISLIKFFFVYLLSKNVLNIDFIKKYKENIEFHVKILAMILFISTIINYIFIIWPNEYRMGILSNKLFYGHPTSLAAVVVFILALIIVINPKLKSNKYTIIMLFIVLLSTLRFKAIASVFVILILSMYIIFSNKKISMLKIGLLGLIALIVGWKQIYFYYFKIDDSARNQMTMKSVEIAKDHFPLGSGFGTFGSYVSGTNYSPIYYKYNLNNIHGLKIDDYRFISDTFWPMILGQFGFFGLVFYVFSVLCLLKNIQNDYDRSRKNIYIAKMICFVYLLISSTSESAYVNPLAIPFAIIMGISYNSYEKKSNKLQEECSCLK